MLVTCWSEDSYLKFWNETFKNERKIGTLDNSWGRYSRDSSSSPSNENPGGQTRWQQNLRHRQRFRHCGGVEGENSLDAWGGVLFWFHSFCHYLIIHSSDLYDATVKHILNMYGCFLACKDKDRIIYLLLEVSDLDGISLWNVWLIWKCSNDAYSHKHVWNRTTLL